MTDIYVPVVDSATPNVQTHDDIVTVGAGAGTVTSVTDDGVGVVSVDNTDPANPIVDSPPYGSSASTITQGNDSRLSDSRPPSGSAGGDLTGTFPNPTIGTNKVTNAKSAQMATKTYKGRTSSGTGDPEDVAVATVKTDLAIVPGDITGFDTQVRTSRLDQMAAPGATVSFNAQSLTNALSIAVQQTSLGSAVQTLASTATNDDPTETVYQGRTTTTDGSTNVTIVTIPIPASTVVTIEAFIIAHWTSGSAGAITDGASYHSGATYINNAGTVTQIGTTSNVWSQESQAAFNGSLSISGTNVLVRGLGQTNFNMTWHATVRVWTVST